MSVFFGAAEGTAYRFHLRSNGPPPAEGDQVKLDVVFVADNHSHLLSTSGSLCQHLVTPRHILGRLHALQLVTAKEILLVPMDLKGDKTEVKQTVVTAHRWPKPATAAIPLAVDPPPSASSAARIQKSSGKEQSFKPRWERDWGSRMPYDFVSRIPPPQGFGPLTSRLSSNGALVALFPVYRDRKEEKVEDYDNPAIENELPVNLVCERPIRFIRYIDLLPSGDPFPAHAKIFDKRFASNDVWSVDSLLQTYFKATKTDPELRMKDWHLLTTPELGLPAQIGVPHLSWSMAGVKHHKELYSHPFEQGPAVLKLVPVARDYECQPTSASSAASYVLKNWRVIVEQDGVQLDVFEYAHGRTVDWMHNMILERLAEMASAERAPGQIVYSMVPYWYCAEVFGVGVRLRDGGSRLPLKTDDNGGQSYFDVPADPHLHSKWGRFDGKDTWKYKPDRFFEPPVEAELRVKVPKGAQDVIIKVDDSISGDYNKLEYAIRPNGSYKAIKAHEWRPLGVNQLDEWIICFLLNLAKVTYGCLNRDLVRPAPPRASPSECSDESSVDEAPRPPRSRGIQRGLAASEDLEDSLTCRSSAGTLISCLHGE